MNDPFRATTTFIYTTCIVYCSYTGTRGASDKCFKCKCNDWSCTASSALPFCWRDKRAEIGVTRWVVLASKLQCHFYTLWIVWSFCISEKLLRVALLHYSRFNKSQWPWPLTSESKWWSPSERSLSSRTACECEQDCTRSSQAVKQFWEAKQWPMWQSFVSDAMEERYLSFLSQLPFNVC